ncbi:MAG: CPBP family intramembrane metalloprotease [Myxococcota bacterium]|nr:CPBP family intramembrane metalloprotease [Myxococcota bacterium]
MPARALAQLWDRVFGIAWRRGEEEAAAFRADPAARRVDTKVITVLVLCAVILTALEYVSLGRGATALARALAEAGWSTGNPRLDRLACWAGIYIALYVPIPMLVVRFGFRESLRDYGLGLRGALRDAWLYGVLLGVLAPVLWVASTLESFQARYPFYDLRAGESLWPWLWAWEGLQLLYFFSLEWFFRGFLVHGLRQRLGFYAVPVMAVPYCMIHFGKPLPETLAAIVAGLVLGSLSLKNRTIWLGVAIHATVALSMDLASLWRRGLLW